MKRAMIDAHAALADRPTARMILTVHDELLFEAPDGQADATAVVAKRVMEEAATLSVPLVVETGIGRNWAAAH